MTIETRNPNSSRLTTWVDGFPTQFQGGLPRGQVQKLYSSLKPDAPVERKTNPLLDRAAWVNPSDFRALYNLDLSLEPKRSRGEKAARPLDLAALVISSGFLAQMQAVQAAATVVEDADFADEE